MLIERIHYMIHIEEESQWWYELAQKECFYLNDRNKVYEKGDGE